MPSMQSLPTVIRRPSDPHPRLPGSSLARTRCAPLTVTSRHTRDACGLVSGAELLRRSGDRKRPVLIYQAATVEGYCTVFVSAHLRMTATTPHLEEPPLSYRSKSQRRGPPGQRGNEWLAETVGSARGGDTSATVDRPA